MMVMKMMMMMIRTTKKQQQQQGFLTHKHKHKHIYFSTSSRIGDGGALGVCALLEEGVEHVVDEARQAVLVLPAPVAAGVGVVEDGRPGLGNLLAEVRLVLNLEGRDALADGGSNLLWREGDGLQVVCALLQQLCVGRHEGVHGLDHVGEHDHRQAGVWLQVAAVGRVRPRDGVVEDVDGIVRSAAAGLRVGRDDAGQAQAAEVHTKALVVVLTEQLHVDLGHAVDGLGPLNRQILRVGHARCCRPKRADGARAEDAQLVDLGELDDVLEANVVEVDGLGHVLLADGAEQRAKVHDPVNVLVDNELLHAVLVEHVEVLVLALEVGRAAADVGADDRVIAVRAAQRAGQRTTELTECTGDEGAGTGLGDRGGLP
eukprot:m.79169 g.79169  ORF g.79169 m.79169 type:complete len:373 (+) comp14781_c0_seq2:387-1505(+)